MPKYRVHALLTLILGTDVVASSPKEAIAQAVPVFAEWKEKLHELCVDDHLEVVEALETDE